MQPLLSTINDLSDRRPASLAVGTTNAPTLGNSSLIQQTGKLTSTIANQSQPDSSSQQAGHHHLPISERVKHQPSAAASSSQSDFAPYQESSCSYYSVVSAPSEKQPSLKALISVYDKETESRRSIEWESHAFFSDFGKQVQQLLANLALQTFQQQQRQQEQVHQLQQQVQQQQHQLQQQRALLLQQQLQQQGNALPPPPGRFSSSSSESSSSSSDSDDEMPPRNAPVSQELDNASAIRSQGFHPPRNVDE